MVPSFDPLTPQAVIAGVEQAYEAALDGTLNPLPSYVNRVYGLRREDGGEFVAKFYRPGRWSREAVLDEHRFLLDCARAELPVVPPLPDGDGHTLAELTVADGAEETEFLFALFPKRGGRNFDAESAADWKRLGGVISRCHAVGAAGTAPHREDCLPETLTAGFLREIHAAGLVHPDCRDEFDAVCAEALQLITPLFQGVALQRVHGDCHRGNILDRPGEGLLLLDFDDLLNAPPVQDLWLLLPGRAADCRREIGLLLEGYTRFREFDSAALALIEPLRFMRLVYFLAWRSRQRHDHWFAKAFPEWGGKAFWIRETEDLRDQLEVIREALEHGPPRV